MSDTIPNPPPERAMLVRPPTRAAYRLVLGLTLCLAVSQPERASAQEAPEPGKREPALYDDSVLHQINLQFEQDDWLALLEANGCRRGFGRPGEPPVERTDVAVAVEIGDERIENAGIRCKGNSSLGINGPKKPLNLTLDAFENGQDLWGFDVINFNNGYFDPSQIRDAIGNKLLSLYMPVPRTAFAAVSVNGDYLGFYTLVEQINGEWADHWYDDNGTIIRGDSPLRIAFESSTLSWEGEDLAPYREGYEVKGDPEDADDGYRLLQALIRGLDAPEAEGGLSDAEFEAGIRQLLDVDLALWHIAGSNIIAHYDSYYVGKNFYLFQGQRDPRFSVINWDLNLAFGTFGYRGPSGQGQGGGRPPGGSTRVPSTDVDPFVQADAETRPLIRRLLAVPAFRAEYLAHYRTMLHEAFTPEWIEEVGRSYQDLIADAVRAEYEVQGNISGGLTWEQFLNSLDTLPSGGSGRGLQAPGLLELVEGRRAYLLGRDDLQAVAIEVDGQALAPEAPTAADPVTVRVRFSGAEAQSIQRVQLRYEVAGGPEQRLEMSQDEGAFQAKIPAQRAGREVTYFFRLGLADGRAHFLPGANWTGPYAYEVDGIQLPQAPPGDLVVNELLADNESGHADASGEREDWVELYNRGDAAIPLDGLFLSDDPEDPYAFPLPDRTLAPGEHLLVICDNEPDEGPLHAPFRLDRGGEAVALSSHTQVLDLIRFGEQEADQSLGRQRDGAEAWERCAQPTPGSANRCDGPLAVGWAWLPWLGHSAPR